jgi:hypothetical protein
MGAHAADQMHIYLGKPYLGVNAHAGPPVRIAVRADGHDDERLPWLVAGRHDGCLPQRHGTAASGMGLLSSSVYLGRWGASLSPCQGFEDAHGAPPHDWLNAYQPGG